jgi:hypothetical protein
MFKIFKKKEKTVLPSLKNPIPMPEIKTKENSIRELIIEECCRDCNKNHNTCNDSNCFTGKLSELCKQIKI